MYIDDYVHLPFTDVLDELKSNSCESTYALCKLFCMHPNLKQLLSYNEFDYVYPIIVNIKL